MQDTPLSMRQRVFDAKNSINVQFSGGIDTSVVLGSGLSDLTLEGFELITRINYADIEGLPRSTAPSHAGELRIVSNGRQNIALCAGRHHIYEGYSAQEVALLTYTLSQLGSKTHIVTNAAGALNPDFLPGDVMLISDHINMTGHNPVIGQDQTFGITFPDMSQAYPHSLRTRCKDAAIELGIELQEGTYLGVTGPSLETSAERRMFRLMGGDAVGMSTVLEVIAANHSGMNVLGLSAITNLALGDENQQPDTIEEVLENAAVAGAKMARVLASVITELPN